MDHVFGRGPKGPAPPARGAVAGVKADMQRAKEGFDPKEPNGVGMAWTHHFLNQKPWHPMNFKNRMRVWEAQQDKSEADKAREKAQAEFDAEQEYLKTLSYLSAEEQQRYREVQSVSFMYTKPPGLDAALARDAEAEKKKKASQPQQQRLQGQAEAVATDGAGGSRAPPSATATAPGAGAGREGPSRGTAESGPGSETGPNTVAAPLPLPPPSRSALVERLREDPLPAMWAAREALANNPRLALRHRSEWGAFGGVGADHPNQQLLGEDIAAGSSGPGTDAELQFLLQLPPDQQLRALKRVAKRRKKEEQERQLREAEAVLRAAGYDLSAVAAPGGGKHSSSGGGGGGGGGSSSSKHKKKRSKSKSHKHKEDRSRRTKRRRESGSNPDSSSPSSSE